MYCQLIFLICCIYSASCTPYLSAFPKKLKVTEKNQHELGLPLGTELTKDHRTGLYIPPAITDDFDPEARLELQFGNQTTARNFCKVGPGVDGSRFTRQFAWAGEWCRSSDGEDLCCGRTRCTCNLVSKNCACLSKESVKYNEERVQRDFDNSVKGINTATNTVEKIAKLFHPVGK